MKNSKRDMVDHSILLRRWLVSHDSSGSASPGESYLRQLTQAICYSGETTPSVFVAHGVSHGSVLGPLLFLVYIGHIAHRSRTWIRMSVLSSVSEAVIHAFCST